MDRVVGHPSIEDGIVWLPVRVGSLRYRVGAVKPGEWVIFHVAQPSAEVLKAARELAVKWEHGHAAEATTLFAEAKALRGATKKK
jgi:hypothetical protein